MKRSLWFLNPVALVLLGPLVATPTSALEIVTKEDLITGVVTEDQLVRVADNAIFLVDASSSMNDTFMDTGRSKLEVTIAEFSERNEFFPDIGHRFGIYQYSPSWREILPLQPYNRDKVGAAIASLPKKGEGSTPLAAGIEKVEPIIQPLTDRTALFLFYDGSYSGRDPNPGLWRLVKEKDSNVCLVIVSSAGEEENAAMEENLARLNACSRLVRLEDYLARPEYTSNALFDVRATERVVTTSQKRVGGAKVENILFHFDKTEFTPEDIAELDQLGAFMKEHPPSYAILGGYTDNVGIEDYNQHLARERTEAVADYLTSKHGVDESRLVLQWYGSNNPIASNDTDEGRAQNRRVEIVVGGL